VLSRLVAAGVLVFVAVALAGAVAHVAPAKAAGAGLKYGPPPPGQPGNGVYKAPDVSQCVQAGSVYPVEVQVGVPKEGPVQGSWEVVGGNGTIPGSQPPLDIPAGKTAVTSTVNIRPTVPGEIHFKVHVTSGQAGNGPGVKVTFSCVFTAGVAVPVLHTDAAPCAENCGYTVTVNDRQHLVTANRCVPSGVPIHLPFVVMSATAPTTFMVGASTIPVSTTPDLNPGSISFSPAPAWVINAARAKLGPADHPFIVTIVPPRSGDSWQFTVPGTEGSSVKIVIPCVLMPTPTGNGISTGNGNGGTGGGKGGTGGTGGGTGGTGGTGGGTGGTGGTGGGTGGAGSVTCPSAAQRPVGIRGLLQVTPTTPTAGTLRQVTRNCILLRVRNGGGSFGSGRVLRPLRQFPPTLGAFAPLVPLVRALPARCVNVQNTSPVRAGQRNAMTVRVVKRGVLMRYAQVRITGPGVTQTKSTGARGAATFTFNPSGPGPLYVQADACIGTDPVPVLFANNVTARGPPAVTG
jgi:hypothetical protein